MKNVCETVSHRVVVSVSLPAYIYIYIYIYIVFRDYERNYLCAVYKESDNNNNNNGYF